MREAWRSNKPLMLVALGLVLFLLVFLVFPVGQVIVVAFQHPQTGAFTYINFVDFFRTALFQESLLNSLYVASASVVLSSLFAVPLAYFTTRFHFKGALIIQTLGVIPLILPPFVGAVAMQLLFGPNGSLNLLLQEGLGFSIPFMEGLNGVILVESVHYFPFILLNLSAALNTIDSSMEEGAQSLGASGLRLFRRIVFPLAAPGYVAGAALVFIKVFDDLGTPLLLNVNTMLAPQAYLRISSIGIADPMGYVISVILVAFSLLALWLSLFTLRNKDYSTEQKGGGGLAQRTMRPWEAVAVYLVVGLILLLVLSPHLSLILLSLGTIWSYSVLPDAYTLAHYLEVFRNATGYLTNTLLYAGLAGLIDILFGAAIAYIVLRSTLPARKWLDYTATAALAVPGVVIGIGYLRTFHSISLPFAEGQSLATWWVVIVIALAVRRLPYALRACMAAIQQISISFEESAENLGARKGRVVRRVVMPLMAGGLAAGFVTSFATASVELSATIMLVSRQSDAPLAYGIYEFMQTAAGRGPGAALGLLAALVVGICTYLSHRIVERGRALREARKIEEAPA